MSTPLSVLVSTWQRLKQTRSRREKEGIIEALFNQLNPDEIEPAVALLLGLPGLTLNVSFRTLATLQPQATLFSSPAGIKGIYERLVQLSQLKGEGSQRHRKAILEELYAPLNPREREFLTGAILDELRCGMSEGIMVDALARHCGVDPDRLRLKLSYSSSTSSFFESVILRGKRGLKTYRPRLLSPIRPMLAQSVDTIEEALQRYPRLSFEFKIDGVRVQIHRSRNRVRIFSRNRKEITEKFPELTEFALGLDLSSAILDGEVVGVDHRGRPLPFQETMRRFGPKQRFLVRPVIFDLLLLNGKLLINKPYQERRILLERVTEFSVPMLVTGSVTAARAFMKKALAAGHEGLVAKTLDGQYLPGKRSRLWLKIKPFMTLDLVITAADWGHGRRRGWLSNLHLACKGAGGLLPLGKTFKGLSDEDLDSLTRRLLGLKIREEAGTVWVRPEVVCEVSFNEIQQSPHYSSGFALRFARIKRIREDKSVDEINTIDDVIKLYQSRIR